MATPKDVWTGIDKDHKYFLVSTLVAPIVIWWIFYGRHAYKTKGMR